MRWSELLLGHREETRDTVGSLRISGVSAAWLELGLAAPELPHLYPVQLALASLPPLFLPSLLVMTEQMLEHWELETGLQSL